MTKEHGYDRIFWLTYLANGLVTLANAMLVRYADFVQVLGGDEQQLGMIVGCGMLGSIVSRIAQGEAIDRYGASRLWMWAMVVYTFSLLLHLTLSTAYGPAVFLTRTLMQSSLACVLGASITFVSLRVPAERMAEMVGALGTSGFIGFMIGPLLSDWLSRNGAAAAIDDGGGAMLDRHVVDRLFWASGAFAAISTLATWGATRESVAPTRRRRPPLWKVLARYHPLMISLTAAAMGAGFSIPMTFLRPFAVEKQLDAVGFFFLVYAVTAFAARMASRPFFERFGNRPWILVGLALLTASYLCYIPATRTWHFAVPGAIAGAAHALLFPSIMAAGTAVFPRRYLGVATSLTLAMFDVGTFVGAPVVGVFLRAAKQHSSSAYEWMFAGTAAVLAAITLAFFVSGSGRRESAS